MLAARSESAQWDSGVLHEPTSALLPSAVYGFTMGPTVCYNTFLCPQKDSLAGYLLCPLLHVVMPSWTWIIPTWMLLLLFFLYLTAICGLMRDCFVSILRMEREGLQVAEWFVQDDGANQWKKKGSGHFLQFRSVFNCPVGFLGKGMQISKEAASIAAVLLCYFFQVIAVSDGERQNVLFISPAHKINTYQNTNTI